MNVQGVIAVLILAALALAQAIEVWFKADTYLRKQRQRRERAYTSKLGALARNPYFKGFDTNPEMELLVARIASLIILAGIAYMGVKVFSP